MEFADGMMEIFNNPDKGFLYLLLGGGYFAFIGSSSRFCSLYSWASG